MPTISMVMQKGGSGKSTLATQLAVYAQQQGQRPLIVDLDPQRSAVVWSDLRQGRSPEAVPSLPSRLGEVIRQAEETFSKTLILVDTAPHTDSGALEAIELADVILCPTKASAFDMSSIKETVGLIGSVGKLGRAIIVINGLTPGKGAASEYADAVNAMREFGVRICATYICHRKAFVTAVGRGAGVTEIAPKDAATAEIKALWKEIHRLQPVANKAEATS
jgi:chromosome partitioning protein